MNGSGAPARESRKATPNRVRVDLRRAYCSPITATLPASTASRAILPRVRNIVNRSDDRIPFPRPKKRGKKNPHKPHENNASEAKDCLYNGGHTVNYAIYAEKGIRKARKQKVESRYFNAARSAFNAATSAVFLSFSATTMASRYTVFASAMRPASP